MIKLYFSILLAFLAYSLNAQVFDVDTLQWKGDVNNRVNLVILGDGYTSSEQTKMHNDAVAIMNKIFLTTPYLQYKEYYNVLLVKVISNQSGANHAHNSVDNACGSQPTATVDNYFGSSFDGGLNGGSYHRLLVVTKYSLVSNVLAANFPAYDQCLVIVNSTYYGGSGGSLAVSSLEASASEIAIHEVGHSFAGLADEYVIDQFEAPNRSTNSDPATVRWKNWLSIQGIGIYTNGGSWFKPANGTCKMQYLGTGYPFCAVCREAHVKKIQTLTKCYDSYTPSNSSALTVSANQTFTIAPVLPSPNTIEVTWTLNGTVIASAANATTYTLPYSSLNGGGVNNTLVATIKDNTSYIKTGTIPSYQITWTVKTQVITAVNNADAAMDIQVVPNPATDLVTITTDRPAFVTVLNTQGTEVMPGTTVEPNGVIDVSGLTSGVYMLQIDLGSQTVMRKIVITD